MSILNFCLIWHLSNLWHRWPWLLKTLFSCLLLEVLPCLWSPLSVPAPRLDLTSKIYGAPLKAHDSAIPWHLLTSLGERFQMHHFWTSHIQLPIWLFYLETSHASQTESVHTGLRFKHTHTHTTLSPLFLVSVNGIAIYSAGQARNLGVILHPSCSFIPQPNIHHLLVPNISWVCLLLSVLHGSTSQ